VHNEKFNDVYTSPNIFKLTKSRRMSWAGHAARLGGKRNAYKYLVAKPEGKRTLGRLRRRWKKNINIGFEGIGWENVDSIYLDQGWASVEVANGSTYTSTVPLFLHWHVTW
jgi:hypothetical protein